MNACAKLPAILLYIVSGTIVPTLVESPGIVDVNKRSFGHLSKITVVMIFTSKAVIALTLERHPNMPTRPNLIARYLSSYF